MISCYADDRTKLLEDDRVMLHRQIVTLLLLYPDRAWDWGRLSLRDDIPFWLILHLADKPWSWSDIASRSPNEVILHPELPWPWDKLHRLVPMDYLNRYPHLPWNKEPIPCSHPQDLVRYPHVNWRYYLSEWHYPFIAEYPELNWPYELISRWADLNVVASYPEIPWVQEEVCHRAFKYDLIAMMRLFPSWPWTEEQLMEAERYSHGPWIKRHTNTYRLVSDSLVMKGGSASSPRHSLSLGGAVSWTRGTSKLVFYTYRDVIALEGTEVFADERLWNCLSRWNFSHVDTGCIILRALRRNRLQRRKRRYLFQLLAIERRLEEKRILPTELWVMVCDYVR